MALKCPPWLEKILKFTWLRMDLNCPPWLEKILKFTCLKWLKMALKCPPWLEKNLKFKCPFYPTYAKALFQCHATPIMPRETPTHAKYIWRNLHGFQTCYLHTMTANFRTAREVHSEIEVLPTRIGFCTPITRAKVGAHAEDLPEVGHILQTGAPTPRLKCQNVDIKLYSPTPRCGGVQTDKNKMIKNHARND